MLNNLLLLEKGRNTLLTKKNILQNKNSFSSFIENINPNYVTGFCDGEACFSVYVSENVKLKNGA